MLPCLKFVIILGGLLLACSHENVSLADGHGTRAGVWEEGRRIFACPAPFLMDAVTDMDGNIWVAAEDGGVWKLEDGNWRSMHREPGFPPTMNCYAVAEDLQGRIWVGTDNKGVAVWNGESWKTYDQLSGLLGERVFAISVSPVSGLVALATSGGLSLYDPVGKTWKSITRAEGLLEDQIEALAFTPKEDLHVAYQCGGVSCASRKDGYRNWRHSQARWYWDRGQRMRQPAERCGTFLPSNLCNAIAVQDERTVWIGTNAGLVRGTNGKYLFTRGKDFQEKNKGLFGGMPKDYRPVESMVIDPVPDLLPEDYVTALFPSSEGVWVGFRQQGAVLLDDRTMKVKKGFSIRIPMCVPDGSAHLSLFLTAGYLQQPMEAVCCRWGRWEKAVCQDCCGGRKGASGTHAVRGRERVPEAGAAVPPAGFFRSRSGGVFS